MARRSFEFKTYGTVHVSFDAEEFRGLTYAEVKEAIRSELPPNVDPVDLAHAAGQMVHEVAMLPRNRD